MSFVYDLAVTRGGGGFIRSFHKAQVVEVEGLSLEFTSLFHHIHRGYCMCVSIIKTLHWLTIRKIATCE